MNLSIIFILTSFCFSISSLEILNTLNLDVQWDFVDYDDELSFFSYKDKSKDIKLIKIEKEIIQDKTDIFKVIKGIENYNSIISNQDLYSKLVKSTQDTIWGYQLIKNSIPFTRDRQYIFKMYPLTPNKLVWTIDDSFVKIDNNINDAKNLTIGAGTWEVKYNDNKKFLINKIYVNDEINIPGLFIDKLRRKHVGRIFKDIMNAVGNNKYGDLK